MRNAQKANQAKVIDKAWKVAQKKRKVNSFGKKKQLVVFPNQRLAELSAIDAFIASKGVTKLETANEPLINGTYGYSQPKVMTNWRG